MPTVVQAFLACVPAGADVGQLGDGIPLQMVRADGAPSKRTVRGDTVTAAAGVGGFSRGRLYTCIQRVSACQPWFVICLAASSSSPSTFHVPMNDKRTYCCAEKGAPVVMLPNYKTVRSATRGKRERGCCSVIVDADVEPVRFCDRACVGGVSTQHQVCYDHLHAPVIFKEDPQTQGSGILLRYCQKMGCQALLPLAKFHGFSPVCSKHQEGRLVDGGPPAVGSIASPLAQLSTVLPDAPQLETLVAGGHGGPDILRVSTCDVAGCDNPAMKKGIVCENHVRVRFQSNSLSLQE